MIRHLLILAGIVPFISFGQANSNDKKVDTFLRQQFEFLDKQLEVLTVLTQKARIFKRP